MQSIADIRKDYKLRSLSEKEMAADPFLQFTQWWEDAVNAQIDEINAMTLATASSDGLPAARIVLLKGYDEKGFIFFTNYNSFKGQQLAENPRACLVFFWAALERQVRITGLVEKTTANESDEYYNTRPEASRIGAWASPQSHVIPDREWLEKNDLKYTDEFAGKPVQRPENWGGYRVKPICIEFWQGRASRLHDRIQYTLEEGGEWKKERLAP
jgi:pyridoxamine 5'-phosphate oxidase